MTELLFGPWLTRFEFAVFVWMRWRILTVPVFDPFDYLLNPDLTLETKIKKQVWWSVLQ